MQEQRRGADSDKERQALGHRLNSGEWQMTLGRDRTLEITSWTIPGPGGMVLWGEGCHLRQSLTSPQLSKL